MLALPNKFLWETCFIHGSGQLDQLGLGNDCCRRQTPTTLTCLVGHGTCNTAVRALYVLCASAIQPISAQNAVVLTWQSTVRKLQNSEKSLLHRKICGRVLENDGQIGMSTDVQKPQAPPTEYGLSLGLGAHGFCRGVANHSVGKTLRILTYTWYTFQEVFKSQLRLCSSVDCSLSSTAPLCMMLEECRDVHISACPSSRDSLPLCRCRRWTDVFL